MNSWKIEKSHDDNIGKLVDLCALKGQDNITQGK